MIKYIYMFDLKNNDISTVLLLIVLGLLIWYLTKPNDQNNNTMTNTTPNPPTNENFTNNSALYYAPVKRNVESVTNGLNQMPEIPRLPPPPVVPALSQPIAKAAVESVVQQVAPVAQAVNDFQAFDGIYNDDSGADINTAFQPAVQTVNTVISAVDINKKNVQNYDAKDFLPKEINDQWFDTDFSQAKTNINDDKLINTERYVIGINTVGQSLKNASYDIRGTIANPKFSVSPWNNSTYEPDYNIKPLC